MPHLLIAGSTGSGKSVGSTAMIMSILYKATPDEVKFILVDPKRLELGMYEEIPHLLTPIVTDAKMAANALRRAVPRWRRATSCWPSRRAQHRPVQQAVPDAETPQPRRCRRPRPQPLPYIVIVIDELADLMMRGTRATSRSPCTRLAQMARAVGIHLILATQRPSVDVITGVIKANFPSRISLPAWPPRCDSRTILDANGRRAPAGQGRHAVPAAGLRRACHAHPRPVRHRERDHPAGRVLEAAGHAGVRPGAPARRPRRRRRRAAASTTATMDDDCTKTPCGWCSRSARPPLSHLQRRLRLGYGRAARILDMMQRDGIVGPKDGARGREILVDPTYLDQLRRGGPDARAGSAGPIRPYPST